MKFVAMLSLALLVIANARPQETSNMCLETAACSPEKSQQALLQVKHDRQRLSERAPELSVVNISAGINPSGAAAPLSQEGYAAVADRCCQAEMEQFIARVAFDLSLELCSDGGIKGLAPYHTCEKGPQTYSKLKADLFENSADRCRSFAPEGECADVPADCPSYEGTIAPDCHCSATKAAKLDFTRAFLGQNNLGGVGPDTGVKEMRYINIFAKPFPVRWSTDTNICIDVAGGDTKNGANVATWECVNNGTHFNMQWTLPPSGTGVIRWTPHPSKCFQVAGGSTANGANLELWECDEANPDQQFIIPASGNGLIKWATHPNRCIKIKGGETFKFAKGAGGANRKSLYLWDCAEGDATQQFIMPKVSDATDLVVTTVNAYTSPSNTEVAANMKNGFGSLRLQWGTSTDFKFRFVESGTSTPRTLEEFHLAFFDLDKTNSGAEFVSGEGYKGYVTDTDTTLAASTLASGRTKFSGTASVPNPTAPGTASDAQRKASVMFFFKETSEFQATFGFEGAGPFTASQYAQLFFAGNSVLVDRCGA